jgi:hypothetical protein
MQRAMDWNYDDCGGGMLRATKFAAKTIRYYSCDGHDSRGEGQANGAGPTRGRHAVRVQMVLPGRDPEQRHRLAVA